MIRILYYENGGHYIDYQSYFYTFLTQNCNQSVYNVLEKQ